MYGIAACANARAGEGAAVGVGFHLAVAQLAASSLVDAPPAVHIHIAQRSGPSAQIEATPAAGHRARFVRKIARGVSFT